MMILVLGDPEWQQRIPAKQNLPLASTGASWLRVEAWPQPESETADRGMTRSPLLSSFSGEGYRSGVPSEVWFHGR